MNKGIDLDNIYHCCVFKTGSQWMRQVLEHRLVQNATGMTCYRYEDDLPGGAESRKINERFFEKPLPQNKILSPLFLSFSCFESIPKPAAYKGFFVTRDPRDILVSWYFSMLKSHPTVGTVNRTRDRLSGLSQDEGLKLSVQILERTGVFDALRSWVNAPAIDPHVRVFKFEDLTGPNQVEAFQAVFEHCAIDLSAEQVTKVLEAVSFKKLSGRSQGVEDASSHYRKGIAGDWKNYLTDPLVEHFRDITGSLVEDLQYD